MTAESLTTQLADQLDWHWTHQLRPRLDGLTTNEYFWEPVENCWTLHTDGSIDFAYPPPEPEPVTTISWRLAHIIVGVLGARNHSHFGGPEADYESWAYATDADTALKQLDEQYDAWNAGVRALSEEQLWRPCGEGGFEDYPMLALVLHINREVIHHGAEIALLRDLYTHTEKEN